jgi:hypothetical protein
LFGGFEVIVVDFADFVLEHAFGECAAPKLNDARRFFSDERSTAGPQHVAVGPTEQVISASLQIVGQSHDEFGARVVVIVAFSVSVVERGLGQGVTDDEPVFVAVWGRAPVELQGRVGGPFLLAVPHVEAGVLKGAVRRYDENL